jgi:hypothetical protein
MSDVNTNPIVGVGDGESAATLQKHGGTNAIEVDSASLLAVLSDIHEELKTLREMIASQL